MGANLCCRVYPDSLGREAIIQKWNAAVDNSLYEDGHSYSGGIGMLEGDITEWRDLAKTENEARIYIHDTQQKWEPAIAVSFMDGTEKKWLIGGWCAS